MEIKCEMFKWPTRNTNTQMKSVRVGENLSKTAKNQGFDVTILSLQTCLSQSEFSWLYEIKIQADATELNQPPPRAQ